MWKLWIDTGGTFTDCFAIDPQGKLSRLKVLSTSTLRGTIKTRLSPSSLQVETKWGIKTDIFKSYRLRVLTGSKDHVSTISHYDPTTTILNLVDPLPPGNLAGKTFEISGGEEVPILAARILTLTPLDKPLPPMEMRLGSTKGTNALLERKGAKVAFLVTKGFRDLQVIGNQQRPALFALNIKKSPPLYQDVLELEERIDAGGNVLAELYSGDINSLITKLKETNTESVAIAFMHSYKNPTHEIVLEEHLRKAGFNHISLSSRLSPNIKILERSQTAVVNAYLQPLIQNYLGNIEEKIADLKVMTSAGGLVNGKQFNPKDSLLSGPAGGVVGAAKVATRAGLHKILTLDMGGTSTDVAHYHNKFDYQYELEIGPARIMTEAMAIETIAAGGGSICAFGGSKLSVGPESAGSSPGPASYGAGGPLTITDINLLLGRLYHGSFSIPVSKSEAESKMREIHQGILKNNPEQPSPESVLFSFLSIANEKMAGAIRKISVERGYDPQEYTLVAFGGAGGLHACAIAGLLHIRKVMIPFEAGLLSAYGIGHARIEKFAQKQFLKPWKEVETSIGKIVQELSERAVKSVKNQIPHDSEIGISAVLLYLRYQGQETSLEIAYTKASEVKRSFEEQYQKLYGHWLPHQSIELESIKVIATSGDSTQAGNPGEPQPYQPEPITYQETVTLTGIETIPVYRWETFRPGASFRGPCILISDHATTFVERGWKVCVDEGLNAVMEVSERSEEKLKQPEEAKLELFTNRFISAVRDMGAMLQRTSFSVNVKERMDFSCALLDAKGELIVNAPHIPVHLGSLGLCVRKVKAHLPMEKGDVVVTNHPAFGGSHLPDITLIAPVYHGRSLIGYVANRAHHAELGGKKPGSMPPDAKTLAEEGVVIPPTYLMQDNHIKWEEIRDIFRHSPYPSRALEENMADLNGALASIKTGQDAIRKLCTLYGPTEVEYYMEALKDYSNQCFKKRIKLLTQSQYQAVEELDDGTRLEVKVAVQNDEITIDFSGTSPPHTGNLNATEAITQSVVLYVMRLLIDKNIPLNEGIVRSVRIHLPESILNPHFNVTGKNPAVVGGNTEVSQRLTDTLLKALGLSGCSQGTMNNFLFGNQRFGYYETICGGTGAGDGFHGADGVHQHMTNTKITDPEIMEFRYPVRLNKFALRSGSGGKGKWHGGEGVIREVTFLESVALTLLSQHRRVPPFGLMGGEAGQPGDQYLIKANGQKVPFRGIDSMTVDPEDRIVIYTPGGGGYGSKDSRETWGVTSNLADAE